MKTKLFTLVIIAFLVNKINAQIGINASNSSPNPAAMLDIASSTKGLLIPRMSTAQKDAIPNKPEGLMVYDTDLKQFSFWNSTIWQAIAGGGGGIPLGWQINGDHLESTNIGNVGIGQSFPNYKLHVNGNGGFLGNSRIAVNESLPGLFYFNSGALQLSTPTNQNFPYGVEKDVLSMDGRGIQAFTRSVDDPYISDYARPLVLNPVAGNVGIGVNNPIYTRFQINGSVASSVAMFGGDKTGISINADNPEIGFNYFYNGTTKTMKTGYGAVLGMYPNSGDMYFGNFNGNQSVADFGNITGFQTVMTIKQNGNIGIGTVNPSHKLSVNGGIRAKEIRVNTGWADYVFEPNYKLKPLTEVEQFIKENGHLPEIPSAIEIQNKGLDVGAVQTKMMAKIEELTLYLIEANKKIEQLEYQVNNKK